MDVINVMFFDISRIGNRERGIIMNINLNETINGVKLSKVCSIKPNGDSAESKSITVEVDFEGSTLQGVFDKAVAGAVIQWQNGQGRKNFDKLTNNQTVKVKFVAPAAKAQVDPMTALIAEAKAKGIGIEMLLASKLAELKGETTPAEEEVEGNE